MIVTATQLAEIYDVERRTVTNWVNSSPPCPSWKDGNIRKFDTAKVDEWRMAQAIAKALANVSRQPPDDIAEAERRKAVADALLAEIKVAKEEGSLVPVEVLEHLTGEMGDRAMAVVTAIPDRYAIDIERLGVDAGAARGVLEQIQDDLARALRGAADDIEADAED